MHIKSIFAGLFCIFSFHYGMSSSLTSHPDSVKSTSENTVWLNGIALLGNKVEISFEKKLSNRFAVETGVVYKYPQPITGPLEAKYKAHGPHQALTDYYKIVETAPFSKGWSGFLNFKYYPVKPQLGFYLATNFFYRNRKYQHREINNQNIGSGSDPNFRYSRQSLNLQAYGFSLLPGYTFYVTTFSNGNSILVDIFTGLSQQYFQTETDFDWKIKNYSNLANFEEQKLNSSSTEKVSFEVVRILGGFKVGFRF